MSENKDLEPPLITIKVLSFCGECFKHTYSEPLTLKYQYNYFKKNYCENCGDEYYMEIEVIACSHEWHADQDNDCNTCIKCGARQEIYTE